MPNASIIKLQNCHARNFRSQGIKKPKKIHKGMINKTSVQSIGSGFRDGKGKDKQ